MVLAQNRASGIIEMVLAQNRVSDVIEMALVQGAGEESGQKMTD